MILNVEPFAPIRKKKKMLVNWVFDLWASLSTIRWYHWVVVVAPPYQTNANQTNQSQEKKNGPMSAMTSYSFSGERYSQSF
mmetsp:Transcript_59915/g.81962  ORF Transcript_59915/g.81962 Transcript_59915/m.81962 type:complete len:81 (-) Transcript_59915:55-297(-)